MVYIYRKRFWKSAIPSKERKIRVPNKRLVKGIINMPPDLHPRWAGVSTRATGKSGAVRRQLVFVKASKVSALFLVILPTQVMQRDLLPQDRNPCDVRSCRSLAATTRRQSSDRRVFTATTGLLKQCPVPLTSPWQSLYPALSPGIHAVMAYW